MADIPLGKTILQLDPHTGAIDLVKSYMEIHVEGRASSVKLLLADIVSAGKSAYEVAVAAGFVGTVQQWLATLKGADGKSAFELAKAAGFQGNEAAWLTSLVGAKGDKGEQGLKGDTGAAGKSAFEIAKEGGFPGNEVGWILSLTGAKGEKGDAGAKGEDGAAGKDGTNGADGAVGKSAFEVAKAGGYPGTEAEWITSLKGAKGDQGDIGPKGTDGLKGDKGEIGDPGSEGKSAYQVALDAGYDGSPEDATGWLASLKGDSAFDVAVEDGFQGTKTEWLASLKGAKGTDGLPGADGKNAVLGSFVGKLSTVEELPPVEEFLQADYFFIGKNIYMNLNGEWVDLGDFSGIPGVDGTGITVMGELADVSFLPAGGGRNGDCWLIGKSMWVWNGTRWQEQGKEGAKGDQGDKGEVGPNGKTAYEVVRAQYPNIDTVDKFVEYIRGLKGDKGDAGLSFVADGTKLDVGDLPPTHVDGHGYLVGNAETGYEFYVWVADQWVNLGSSVGPQGEIGPAGPIGPQGPRGHSTTPKGKLAEVGMLPVADNTIGDTYNILGVQYTWDGDSWENMGDLTGPPGSKGDTGIAGPAGPALIAKGQLASTDDLTELAATAQPGWAYEINGNIFVFSEGAFVDMGKWKGTDGINGTNGADGAKGADGAAGKSNYQIAVEAGFVGDEAAWLLTMTGPKGADGTDGSKGDQGDIGPKGTDGLKGDKGDNGTGLKFLGDFTGSALPAGVNADTATKDGRFHAHNGTAWVDIGAVGTKGDKGEVGANGKSAFDVAKEGGFGGDSTAWLASLKGATGSVGKSFFQDAVDSGLFSGTLEQFIAAQKGATGASTLELAISQGLLTEGASAQDLINLTTGPAGPDGEQGLKGDTGPAISIIGTKADQASLPVTGVVGTGYAVPDAATPGTYDCWIWLDGTGWFNLGHIVGSQGPKGDQGIRGLQGTKGTTGEKGDRGSVWIVLDRDPQSLDGRVDDYFFNKNTQQFFRKTDIAVWAALGYIGGGNVNMPSSNGKFKGFKESDWVDLPLLDTIPADTGTYILKAGVWTRFDTYTLAAQAVAIAAGVAVVDLSVARTFRIANTVAARVDIKNLPAADRSTTFLVKVYGKVGAFNWTLPSGTIRWFDGAAPTFTNDTTTIVLTWDGQEMTGAVPN